MTTPQTLINLPAELLPIVQEGWLEREFLEALMCTYGYTLDAVPVALSANVGETQTKTVLGRKKPRTKPINPTEKDDLDSGLVPKAYEAEQYKFTLNEYGDAIPLNLMDDEVTIKSRFLENARKSAQQAAQTLEWLGRKKLFARYNTGDTRAYQASSGATVKVDDIRGFQEARVNGVLQPVSSTNPLAVTVNGENLNVIGAAADSTNVSTFPVGGDEDGGGNPVSDGISGTLTFAVAPSAQIQVGDRILAKNAPLILRPNNRATTAAILGQDLLKYVLIQSAVAYLRKQGTPPFADGFYHVVYDDDSELQLFQDPMFQVLFKGQYGSQEVQKARMFTLLDCKFIRTTEAYLQDPIGSATHRVHRVVVMGDEALAQGNFEGLENWVRRMQQMPKLSDVRLVDQIAMILRGPLSIMQEDIIQAWKWVGDFECRSDATTKPTTTPTASKADYKRAVVIEHAGT